MPLSEEAPLDITEASFAPDEARVATQYASLVATEALLAAKDAPRAPMYASDGVMSVYATAEEAKQKSFQRAATDEDAANVNELARFPYDEAPTSSTRLSSVVP